MASHRTMALAALAMLYLASAEGAPINDEIVPEQATQEDPRLLFAAELVERTDDLLTKHRLGRSQLSGTTTSVLGSAPETVFVTRRKAKLCGPLTGHPCKSVFRNDQGPFDQAEAKARK